ncbi:transcription-repair coupling factor [Chlorobium sp. N1]|uniref:transcription-repair coupling factor n=1 Tax=Chlorobium sp. N1 TaxID=2491138 RepID=UPI001F60B179|nr:transcription-repair coupling factor [Chlorobium sp. N1]
MKTITGQAPPSSLLVRKKTRFLTEAVSGSEPFALLLKALSHAGGKKNSVKASGIRSSLGPVLAAALHEACEAPVLVLAGAQSFDLYDHDLTALAPGAPACSTADGLPAAIAALRNGGRPLILSSFDDLRTPLCRPEEAAGRVFAIEKDRDAGYEALKGFLEENRFEHREFVEDEGEYSVRGSIVDVFPYGTQEPVRIEFFGDTVTSLRSFDINSQLSGRSLASAELSADLADGGEGAGATMLDYLPPATLVIVDSPSELLAEEDGEQLENALRRFTRIETGPAAEDAVDFGSSEQMKINANFRMFATRLSREGTERTIVFAASSEREVRELADFLTEEAAEAGEETLREIAWVPANLHSGFRFGKIDLYTEADIFGKLHSRRARRKRKLRGISLKDLQKLKVGDHVVHEDYGVGIFRSMESITAGGSEQECVLVEYEGGDQLFVNVQNINLLSKYAASEGSKPILSKLGSPKWAAKKEKVRSKIRDIAINLIKLYAQRKMQPGFAFGEDSIFMREFESSFIFEETPDQLKTIGEVKKDMQAPHPMDRLICGDAGFGKTEIAMRAAFKAVESKKQVAVLTPTTILAHQHLETFRKRFENFPISIVILSRFVSRAEQKEAIERIGEGKVDIVIGTHRLVSKDVRFRDLGLLVIDEEQHFGVEVKEKLREQFPGVDTLTMSATPIPRTLQFSMLGARDLSIVSTPPKNRQPVETVITDFDEELIRSAIEREISRDGQVFFLHNRVGGLEEMQQRLRSLVPRARIVFAHGQMPARELEKIMMDVMQGEADVLISTTIIGSGIDISNANTIIINRADMFGLSDLYQLRGRVGRSDRKAHCYLVTPPLHTLKREAVQRLAVIESFTELGSGFSIALRDLDIRGAGNLLGAEQSGYIHDLGFDLYQKMLEETVAELKSGDFSHLFTGETRPALPEKPTDMAFSFDALIPEHYLAATHERFMFYEKISRASGAAEVDAIGRELRDRFGPMPEEVQTLLLLTKLKLTASPLGLEKIDLQPKTATLFLPEAKEEGPLAGRAFLQHLFTAVQEPVLEPYAPAFSFEKKMKLVLHHPAGADTAPPALLRRYTGLLQELESAAEKESAASN